MAHYSGNVAGGAAKEHKTPKQNKDRKKAWKRKKAQKKLGDDFLPEGRYFEQKHEQQEAEQARRGEQRFEAASQLFVPVDCQLELLMFVDYNTYVQADAGKQVMASHALDSDANNIIWFNDLDPKHTFNLKNSRIARANLGLVQCAVATGKVNEIEPRMLVGYALACIELRNAPTKYIDRLAFLKLWNSSFEDIIAFSNKQARTFDKAARELHAALESDGMLAEAGNRALVADMREALEDVEMEVGDGVMIDEEGEKLAAGVVQEDNFADMNAKGESNGTDAFFVYPFEPLEEGEEEEGQKQEHREWVDNVLTLCCLYADELLEARPRDHRRLLALYNKMAGLMEEQELRKICKSFGFHEFAYK